MARFVCAFRGRRDSYQAPLALAEGNMLEQFITDAYATPLAKAFEELLPHAARKKLELREEQGIPDDLVKCLWGTALMEKVWLLSGRQSLLTLKRFDRHYSLAAEEAARRRRADLFLYSPYAWEAFTAHYNHAPRRILFQYHPHPAMEKRLIEQDSVRHPCFGESFSGDDAARLPEALFRRESEVWRHADLIFCASHFTLRSLVEAGCEASRCRIVPYGIDLPPVLPESPSPDTFEVAFVGSGGQRKGLHHLLLAWTSANLPSASRLTLVCRVLDRGIEALAARTPRVRLLRGVPPEQLSSLYARSHLFAMPSLVEGFGQVYLEALAHGCPVLGTPHTALPDLGGEADGIYLTPASDVEALAALLERLSRSLPGNAAARKSARTTAERYTWRAFREALRKPLESV